MFVPEEAVAALDLLGPAGRVKHFEVVSRFRMPVGEDRAARGLLEHPNLGGVALSPQLAGDTGRAQMHVDG